MTKPNTAQFQLSKDQGHDQDVQLKVALTGAAAESTQLTVQQLVAEILPPASGVHTFILPALDLWKNQWAVYRQVASAPGGEAKFVLKENNSTDPIGDNLSAADDHVFFFNFQGEKVMVNKETTT